MPELLTGAKVRTLFDGVTRSAERLETRDHYGGDQAELEAWLGGQYEEIPERAERAAWLERIRLQTSRGARWRRVRIIREPPTVYQRFGLMSGRQNVEAGEQIHYLGRECALAEDLPAHDFWLFDDERLALMYFGFDDRLLGVQLVADTGVVAQHRVWLDRAFSVAPAYHEYLAADPTWAERPGVRRG
jgi:hypothetical protein